jgi:hypothetical protein
MDGSFVLLVLFVASIFVWDATRRAWRQNEWKRRWRQSLREEQGGT